MTTIIEDVKLDFCDVLLMPKRSTLETRRNVDIQRTFKFKHSSVTYTGVPIIAANMDTVGTMEMANAFNTYGMPVALHKFYTIEQLVKYFSNRESNKYTFYTMGTHADDYSKFLNVQEQVIDAGGRIEFVCVDIANGYSRLLAKRVEQIRKEHPNIVIMAGNVVTGDMVYDLLERGADIVKVGIGPGSVCTTRRITGVGYPQLSAILECQDAAHGAGGLICGDGGIVTPGCAAKAFAAGADFIMCGGILAGHDESGGENIYAPDSGLITHKKFYGMSSHEAMDKHYGGKASHRAAEGKVVQVPYKGKVADTINEIHGGIRSACTYIGASRLKDMAKCATFVRVNRILNDSLSGYNV